MQKYSWTNTDGLGPCELWAEPQSEGNGWKESAVAGDDAVMIILFLFYQNHEIYDKDYCDSMTTNSI